MKRRSFFGVSICGLLGFLGYNKKTHLTKKDAETIIRCKGRLVGENIKLERGQTLNCTTPNLTNLSIKNCKIKYF